MTMIPYIAHESEMMRMEKHTRRLWIALLIAILILVVSNLLWMLHSREKGYEGGANAERIENSAIILDGDPEHNEDN